MSSEHDDGGIFAFFQSKPQPEQREQPSSERNRHVEEKGMFEDLVQLTQKWCCAIKEQPEFAYTTQEPTASSPSHINHASNVEKALAQESARTLPPASNSSQESTRQAPLSARSQEFARQLPPASFTGARNRAKLMEASDEGPEPSLFFPASSSHANRENHEEQVFQNRDRNPSQSPTNEADPHSREDIPDNGYFSSLSQDFVDERSPVGTIPERPWGPLAPIDPTPPAATVSDSASARSVSDTGNGKKSEHVNGQSVVGSGDGAGRRDPKIDSSSSSPQLAGNLPDSNTPAIEMRASELAESEKGPKTNFSNQLAAAPEMRVSEMTSGSPSRSLEDNFSGSNGVPRDGFQRTGNTNLEVDEIQPVDSPDRTNPTGSAGKPTRPLGNRVLEDPILLQDDLKLLDSPLSSRGRNSTGKPSAHSGGGSPVHELKSMGSKRRNTLANAMSYKEDDDELSPMASSEETAHPYGRTGSKANDDAKPSEAHVKRRVRLTVIEQAKKPPHHPLAFGDGSHKKNSQSPTPKSSKKRGSYEWAFALVSSRKMSDEDIRICDDLVQGEGSQIRTAILRALADIYHFPRVDQVHVDTKTPGEMMVFLSESQDIGTHVPTPNQLCESLLRQARDSNSRLVELLDGYTITSAECTDMPVEEAGRGSDSPMSSLVKKKSSRILSAVGRVSTILKKGGHHGG
eukprot:CAMPEP_0181347780 /NCGR_PEP_ID=MMETSP1101-20121128/34059_1 /TAXON_ID=46948 /ORGANISM="Rhodomonas abbreviata, Strain Caron Lab Isolate" /LENGTH=686 /DNA_ID=CAMNT_0023460013 /DNA_START=136 /DNA_END=2192 /DNA_ORIENTATION=-